MTSVRTLAVTRLMELVADEIAAESTFPERVQVTDHDPGGNRMGEAIFVVDIQGDQELDRFGDAALTTDDFTVTVVCVARLAGQTGPQARDRVDEFYQAIRRVALGYSRTLDDYELEGGHHPITFTETTRVEGPISDPAGDSGHVGFARVDVRIVTNEVSP